jgi:hypothetical protein
VVAFVAGMALATAAMPSAQWAAARPGGAHHRDG